MATSPDTQATVPRRELAAIMFSDIAGYTAIMGRDEQEGLDARDAHRELLRTILPDFNGRLLGDLGDGALFELPQRDRCGELRARIPGRERKLFSSQDSPAHSQWLCWLKMDPIFDPLRREPRFIGLLRKLNFGK
jgi:class 3 adenylate cyclase